MGEWLRRLSGTIGQVVEPLPVTGSQSEPLFGLVARMREAGDTVALITDAEGRVAGLLTAEDLLQRALFTLEPDQPTAAALGPRISPLRPHDRIYRALAEMKRQRRRCLPVVDGAGRAIGVVWTDRVSGFLAGEILTQLDAAIVSETAPPSPETHAAQAAIAATLLASREPVTETIALINALNDDIARSVLQRTRETMAADGWGEPPVEFAVLVMGSAGRGESLLHPDQDNGFILADHPDLEHDQIDRYFVELARRFTRGLALAGFPLCSGDVMATNPLWRKSLQQWRTQVTQWMGSRGNEAMMFTDIFYDFRDIAGPPELAGALRRHVTEAARDNLPFLAQMSWLQKDHTSSVDVFGQLIAKDGPEQDAIDLKLRATKPLVEIVRLLALKSGVAATGTAMRLAGLAEAGVLAPEDARKLSDDLAFLLELLLRHQIGRMSEGRIPDNCIKPGSLDRPTEARLVQACRHIHRWRHRLIADFIPALG